MRITVFGASGKVGRLVVENALKRDHEVLAFVHSSDPFETHEKLSVVKGDIHNETDVVKAVQNSQAVISALGSWGTKEKDIVSEATRHIIPAMEQASVTRFVGLTGTAAFMNTDRPNLLYGIGHKIFGLVAPKIQYDGEEAIKLLQASHLEWTIVRSPGMINSKQAAYLLLQDFPAPWKFVSRQSVARSLVDLIESKDFLCQAPFIVNG